MFPLSVTIEVGGRPPDKTFYIRSTDVPHCFRLSALVYNII